MRQFIWITLFVVQLIAVCKATTDEPLGRNYRKNFNSYPVNNNGKILSTSDTKISSVSYKPNESKFGSFSDGSNLKTAASEEEEKFSIGLGVLSPSYSQKFGEDGKTKLDFNSEKGGFSYSLTNVVHPHQPGASSSASLSQGSAATSSPIATNTLNKVQTAGFVPSTYYNQPSAPQPNPQVNIYHKQSADQASQAIYGRLSPNSNNYPIPPNSNNYPPTSSPYSPSPPQSSPLPNPLASPYPDPFSGYNPYAASPALGPPQQFNPNLSDAEKSFLQTVPQGPQIAAHQHSLPQPLPSSSSQQPSSITQPKLVAQQSLTANPSPGNIVHSGNYGPYSNPYNTPNPYAASPNPYAASGLGGYPGLLNMAASQQYPMNMMSDQMGGPGGMNYDYLSSLNDPFMY